MGRVAGSRKRKEPARAKVGPAPCAGCGDPSYTLYCDACVPPLRDPMYFDPGAYDPVIYPDAAEPGDDRRRNGRPRNQVTGRVVQAWEARS